jgi:tetratricopeptide (TPR) repeat protein
VSNCPPRVKLLQMIHDGEEVPHLAECLECAQFVADADAVLALTGDADELRHAAAEEVNAAIAGAPPYRIASTIVEERGLHRSIVVRDLLARADALYGSDPGRAIVFTRAAVGVCDVMRSAGAAVAALYVDALKDHAALLRRLGRYDEALEALARAWSMANETPEREHCRAVVTLSTALVYAEPDVARFDEALTLAETAAAILEVCGDVRRAMLARHARAHVLAVMEKHDAAAEIMTEVIGASRVLSAHDLAIAHDLMAYCLLNLGRFDEARHHVAEGLARYVETADVIGHASLAHTGARAVAALGNFEDALPVFEHSAEVIFTARLFDWWTIMRLDFVAAALDADPSAEVRHTLESVARVCYSSQASPERSRHAAEALDYLRRLAVRDALTTECVRHVRRFVARNSAQPPVRFTPPAAGAEFIM